MENVQVRFIRYIFFQRKVETVFILSLYLLVMGQCIAVKSVKHYILTMCFLSRIHRLSLR
jgi:hypothetical protein